MSSCTLTCGRFVLATQSSSLLEKENTIMRLEIFKVSSTVIRIIHRLLYINDAWTTRKYCDFGLPT